MARLSGPQKDYNNQTNAWQTQAQAGAAGEIGKYDKNISTLESGQDVGKNPFKSADYLGNQNKLTAYSLEGENAAAKQNLEDANFRGGGGNTSGTDYSIKNLALGKMRLSNQLQAQRSADDMKSNLGWQQYLAGAPLQGASQWGDLFKTATQGRDTIMGQQQSSGFDAVAEGLEKAAPTAALLI